MADCWLCVWRVYCRPTDAPAAVAAGRWSSFRKRRAAPRGRLHASDAHARLRWGSGGARARRGQGLAVYAMSSQLASAEAHRKRAESRRGGVSVRGYSAWRCNVRISGAATVPSAGRGAGARGYNRNNTRVCGVMSSVSSFCGRVTVTVQVESVKTHKRRCSNPRWTTHWRDAFV